MVASILIVAILALFFGGMLMALQSKRAALLDARISMGIGHRLFPKRMRWVWNRAESFKKNAGHKNMILAYKITGIVAVLLGIGLAIFLVTIS